MAVVTSTKDQIVALANAVMVTDLAVLDFLESIGVEAEQKCLVEYDAGYHSIKLTRMVFLGNPTPKR